MAKRTTRPRARPNTVDLTPNAEDGDQMLAKRPKRPRARPTDLTPNAERPSADDLEFMLRRRQGAQTRRPVEEGDEGRERKMANGGKVKKVAKERPTAPRTSPSPRARGVAPSAEDVEARARNKVATLPRGDADDRRPGTRDTDRIATRTDKMAKGGKAKAKKMSYGGKAKVKKMKDGGMCRGMGAATRGGNYKMG